MVLRSEHVDNTYLCKVIIPKDKVTALICLAFMILLQFAMQDGETQKVSRRYRLLDPIRLSGSIEAQLVEWILMARVSSPYNNSEQ